MFKYTDDNHHLNFQDTSQFVKFHSFQLQCRWHLDMSIWGTGKLWQPIMIIRIKNITGFSPKRRLIHWYRIKLMASVLIGTMFDYLILLSHILCIHFFSLPTCHSNSQTVIYTFHSIWCVLKCVNQFVVISRCFHLYKPILIFSFYGVL